MRDFTQLQWGPALEDDCRRLIRLAVREDLDQGYDWTTVSLVPEASEAEADVVARRAGVVAGMLTIPVVTDEIDAPLQWTPACEEGSHVDAGGVIGKLAGPARDLLTVERLLLNLLGRLSGIASLTRQYVDRVADTPARIYDTRKTCPGYRRLEKYAVLCGGGHNHRTGLFDAILIKDNHLAFGSNDAQQRYTPAQAVQTARDFVHKTFDAEKAESMIVQIEVDTLDQLRDVLPSVPDIVLLDNMTAEDLRAAVEIRNAAGSRTQLEASGGVGLSTVSDIAATGVERISVGALTHSAHYLDIGLDWRTKADPNAS